MGCLRNVMKAIVITLAIVGFFSLGGKDLVNKWVGDFLNPSQDKMIEKAKKVGDFSKINDEFEIEKAAGILGYNAVVAEHKASGQKLIVIDSGNKPILTVEDIKSPNIENKLENAIKNLKYNTVSVDNLRVTKRGELVSYSQTIPYVKFEAKVKRLPIGEVSGMIAAVNTTKGDRLLFSIGEKDKYSQLIATEFFKNIK